LLTPRAGFAAVIRGGLTAQAPLRHAGQSARVQQPGSCSPEQRRGSEPVQARHFAVARARQASSGQRVHECRRRTPDGERGVGCRRRRAGSCSPDVPPETRARSRFESASHLLSWVGGAR
jgi:hypothetical protein